MSTLFISNIAGTGTYAVPTNDTELANAQAGLAALLGGVAGLTFNAVLAWVDINSGTTTRILNCFVSNYQYNGEICPDDTEFAAMVAAINAALVADPNITSVSDQYSNLESSPTAPPAPHEASHLSGGSDAISSVAGLTGLLATPQTPAGHEASHLSGGADAISSVAGLTGLLATPQTPAGHEASHLSGGADAISSVAGLTGLLATPQTPAAHNLGGAEHNADTLANLNLKISDATLVDGGPVLSNLWAVPATPTPEDEEFDNVGDLPGLFNVWNLSAAGPSGFGPGTPTPYISPPSMRTVSNIPTRRSWGFLQPEAGSPLYYVYKPYFSFSPSVATHVMLSRMKFNQTLTPGANDASIGICIAGQSGGNPDSNNYVVMFLNATSGGIRAQLYAFLAGGPGVVVAQSSPLTAEGQALEYVALHVFPPVFHGWVGTAGGNWIYIGNVNAPSVIPFFFGMVARNGASAIPGTPVLGVDFMRFYPGDTTFLF